LEVYGFVGSISTIVATGLFFLWAYLPEPWLHYLGITYYPSRFKLYGNSSFNVMEFSF
jgi:phosphatidylinositol glycan class P protein